MRVHLLHSHHREDPLFKVTLAKLSTDLRPLAASDPLSHFFKRTKTYQAFMQLIVTGWPYISAGKS